MLKLKIYQILNFLETVNTCQGAVYLLNPDGSQTDIHSSYAAQDELLQQYNKNAGSITLALHIPTPSDYMCMVNFMIGNH